MHMNIKIHAHDHNRQMKITKRYSANSLAFSLCFCAKYGLLIPKKHTQHTFETNWLRGFKAIDMIDKEKGQNFEKEEDIGRLLMGIMEGYKDSVIPPLSEFNPVNYMANCEKGSSSSMKRARIEAPEAERLRRGKMAESFSVLQSMVPSLFPNIIKPTREKVVTETIDYIRKLEGEAERLEGLKKSLLEKPLEKRPALFGCTSSYLKPSVAASVSNGIAFFGVQLPAKRGLLSKIFSVFGKHHAEVLEVTILVNDQRMLTLTGTFDVGSEGGNVVEKIKREILIL